MTERDRQRLIVGDKLTQAQLEALPAGELAELRRVMLTALARCLEQHVGQEAHPPAGAASSATDRGGPRFACATLVLLRQR